ADYPVVNFRIFRHRSFFIGNVTMFVLGLVLYCSMFALPLFCQNILRLTAQQTGVLLIPSTLVSMFMMPVAGALFKKGVPGQILGVLGVLLFFSCFLMMTRPTIDTGAGFFFWPMIILGVGRSFMFVPFTALAMQDLEGKEIAQGTGINNLMRQLGGTLGVAVFTTVLAVQTFQYRNILIEQVNNYNPVFVERYQMLTSGFAGKGFSPDQTQGMALKSVENSVMVQSQLLTYNHIYMIAAILIICCVPLFLMQKSRKITTVNEKIT
ncbi:MAG TPA: MFS transporter, partial [Bacteroidales bacterium]